MSEPERLTGVAINHEGRVYTLAAPNRHNHLIAHAREVLELPKEACDVKNQGFVTSTGRFVTRKEAVGIARAARQLKRDIGRATILFSEDCW